jgi:hypothetical protein
MSQRGQQHDFGRLALRAERKMRQWRATLTKSERTEIGELTRQERVSFEIEQERRERARRTVVTTVAASAGERVTTGPTHSAMPVRKAGGRVAAGSLRSQVAANSPGEKRAATVRGEVLARPGSAEHCALVSGTNLA